MQIGRFCTPQPKIIEQLAGAPNELAPRMPDGTYRERLLARAGRRAGLATDDGNQPTAEHVLN